MIPLELFPTPVGVTKLDNPQMILYEEGVVFIANRHAPVRKNSFLG